MAILQLAIIKSNTLICIYNAKLQIIAYLCINVQYTYIHTCIHTFIQLYTYYIYIHACMYVLYSAIDVMHTHYWVNCLLHM